MEYEIVKVEACEWELLVNNLRERIKKMTNEIEKEIEVVSSVSTD